MKKTLFALAAAAAVPVSLYAASDRIDIFAADGSFVSVMADDLKSISVVGDQVAGYHTMKVVLKNGAEYNGTIADMADMLYRHADRTTLFEITRVNAPNARVTLLDCRNNDGIMDPNKPDDWRASEADGMPHFLINTDKGYESSYRIVGDYTGTDYTAVNGFVFWSPKDQNLLGLDCWSYLMPFEPVSMVAASEILHTYDGQPFLGTYKGCLLSGGDSRLSVGPEKNFEIEMRGNGTYVFTTTDEQAFNVLDLYSYDAGKGSFAYVPYDGPLKNPIDLEVKHGAVGTFVDGDFMFVDIHDILNDQPENMRRYIAGRGEYDLVVADADEYGFKRLVEIAPAGGAKKWFWLENYGSTRTPVVMNFGEGASIGENGAVGFGAADGENIFKYEKNSAGEPVFTMRGAEYGTYSGAAGDLDLDGFGNASIGFDFGLDYKVDGGIVTLTDLSGATRMFVVDRADYTYSELVATPWDGPVTFVTDEAAGAFAGGQETSTHYVRIAIDQNLNGSANRGYCSVEVKIDRRDGMSPLTAIASGGKYLYDAAGKRLIVTNVYYGNDATSSARHNLVLKVADDKKSLWFDDSVSDKVYGTSRDGSYIVAGQDNAIAAEVTAPSLAASYSGNLKLQSFGSEADVATTLTIDTASQKASIKATGMGATLLDSKNVDYELSGDILVLKNVDVADPNGFGYLTTKGDLSFTLQADGSLVGIGTTKVNAMGMLMDLKLEGCVLTPAF
ncbi:MAG: hypothetical protein K2O10_00565 [Muribaculaceae bacterium]|nr:hypothetical protein [Muribaculaceae bacterium]